MKPLVNLPSWGTLRSGPQRLILFLLIAGTPVLIVLFLFLWPIAPNLANTYWKKPVWVWRTALFASATVSLLLIVPWSLLFIDRFVAIKGPPVEKVGLFGVAVENPGIGMYLDYIGIPIFFGIVIVAPLIPLVCISTIHTVWARRRHAGPPPTQSLPSIQGGPPPEANRGEAAGPS